MSQGWQIPIVGSTNILISISAWNEAMDNLRSNSSGTSDPSVGGQPFTGQIWADSNNDLIKVYTGTTFSTLFTIGSGGLFLLKDGSNSMEGELNFNNQGRITNVGEPVNGTDAATKQYVDKNYALEFGSYSGNDVERTITLANQNIVPAWIDIIRSDNAFADPWRWTFGIDSPSSQKWDNGQYEPGRIIDKGKGFFKLGDGTFPEVNEDGGEYDYFVFGEEDIS